MTKDTRTRKLETEHKLTTCFWCKRENQRCAMGWDRQYYCVDRPDCEADRSRTLIETGKRPRSFYEKLAAGRYENRRDCRKVGMTNDDIKALVEGMGLTYETKETKDSEQRAADDNADA